MHENAIWDDDEETWLFVQEYNFAELEKKISVHLAAGGSSRQNVLAGVCKTSEGTMQRWLDKQSPYYQIDLSKLIVKYKNLSASATDEFHRQAAIGSIKGDAKLLQARYNDIVKHVDTLKLSRKTRDAMSTDDVKLQVACLKNDLAKRRITLTQFSQLTASLMQAADIDVTEMQAMIKKLIDR